MARYGVSVTMSMAFRGGVQQFSNTAYFEAPVDQQSASVAQDLGDKVVAILRQHHSTVVTFVRCRVWSQVGTQSGNQMLYDADLTGTGAIATSGTYDRERAFLVQVKAGKDTRGRDVYLRKWLHLQVSGIGGATFDSGQVGNVTPLTTAQRDALKAILNQLMTIPYTVGSNWDLVAKNGREITGDAEAHRWMEHHQLGDEWRGQ